MGGRAELRGLFKRNGLLIKMLFSILGLICIPLVCLQLLTVLHANREFQRESLREFLQESLREFQQESLRESLRESLQESLRESQRESQRESLQE